MVAVKDMRKRGEGLKESRGDGREKAQKVFSGCLRAISGTRFRDQFWLRPVWSPRRPIYAALRYQLVALATYLAKPRFKDSAQPELAESEPESQTETG